MSRGADTIMGARNEPIVSRASLAEAAEILALQKLAYASEAAIYNDFSIAPLLQTEDEMRADLELKVVLKATVDGRIVGSIRAFEREGVCHIGRLVVEPALQNRGLGRRLLGEIERLFSLAQRFELFTGHRSERNLHLYRKLGYIERRVEKVTDTRSLVFLQKENGSRGAD